MIVLYVNRATNSLLVRKPNFINMGPHFSGVSHARTGILCDAATELLD